ncbi:hypothetical protein EVAR_30989_1 [Eumeta japonica]|uniref:Uncharacterized protein n=1 Tax=Eumeta variegata TaxID=151549 RepID=A0A4C1W9Y0_EUMVA|nr:hypothetical protein EVAR_30989_1 [Eumeta japonica]
MGQRGGVSAWRCVSVEVGQRGGGSAWRPSRLNLLSEMRGCGNIRLREKKQLVHRRRVNVNGKAGWLCLNKVAVIPGGLLALIKSTLWAFCGAADSRL